MPASMPQPHLFGGERAGTPSRPVSRHVDLVQHARELRRSPALRDLQVRDDVGDALAVVDEVRSLVDAAEAVDAADVVHLRAAAAAAVAAGALDRDARGEAAAERGGVGQQVRLVEALLVGGEEVRPARSAARERVERRRLTSGDARPRSRRPG